MNTQEIQKQYVVGNNEWSVALVAPTGEVVGTEGLGHVGMCSASSYVIDEIIAALQSSNISGSKLVLLSPHQMLCNESLMQWHSIRLAWGSANPEEKFACCPNGKDLDWHLYWCGNGTQDEFASGSLPADWWEIDQDERDYRIERQSWGA